VDSAVYLTIQSLLDGAFEGGRNEVFGLDQDGVGLGKISPKAAKADVEQVDKVEQEIAAGEIEVPTTV
jgi:basic membrane protein A